MKYLYLTLLFLANIGNLGAQTCAEVKLLSNCPRIPLDQTNVMESNLMDSTVNPFCIGNNLYAVVNNDLVDLKLKYQLKTKRILIGKKLYFIAKGDDKIGYELYTYNIVTQKAALCKDLRLGQMSSAASILGAMGNHLILAYKKNADENFIIKLNTATDSIEKSVPCPLYINEDEGIFGELDYYENNGIYTRNNMFFANYLIFTHNEIPYSLDQDLNLVKYSDAKYKRFAIIDNNLVLFSRFGIIIHNKDLRNEYTPPPFTTFESNPFYLNGVWYILYQEYPTTGDQLILGQITVMAMKVGVKKIAMIDLIKNYRSPAGAENFIFAHKVGKGYNMVAKSKDLGVELFRIDEKLKFSNVLDFSLGDASSYPVFVKHTTNYVYYAVTKNDSLYLLQVDADGKYKASGVGAKPAPAPYDAMKPRMYQSGNGYLFSYTNSPVFQVREAPFGICPVLSKEAAPYTPILKAIVKDGSSTYIYGDGRVSTLK
jgi:hypothetical protein